MHVSEERRRFLAALAATSAAGLIGSRNSSARDEQLETTSVRLAKITGTCIAPQYLAEELLRLEGFTDVRYILFEAGLGQSKAIARGDVDFSLNFAAPLVIPIDAGEPISVIAGVHTGCFELFGHDRIRSIADLKGRTVGVQGLGGSPHVFLAAMAAHVGLDPMKDINWVTSPTIVPNSSTTIAMCALPCLNSSSIWTRGLVSGATMYSRMSCATRNWGTRRPPAIAARRLAHNGSRSL